MKYGYICPSGFRGIVFLAVWTDNDGASLSYKNYHGTFGSVKLRRRRRRKKKEEEKKTRQQMDTRRVGEY